AALGVDPVTSARIATGIIQWRGAAPDLGISPDASSFRPRGSSLEQLEEILLIPGMTPDIFYGRYDHDPSGRLIPRGGLRDCLTVWGNPQTIDVNTAAPARLESLGRAGHRCAASATSVHIDGPSHAIAGRSGTRSAALGNRDQHLLDLARNGAGANRQWPALGFAPHRGGGGEIPGHNQIRNAV